MIMVLARKSASSVNLLVGISEFPPPCGLLLGAVFEEDEDEEVADDDDVEVLDDDDDEDDEDDEEIGATAVKDDLVFSDVDVSAIIRLNKHSSKREMPVYFIFVYENSN